MRLTKTERIAAGIVLAMAASVAGAGVKLLKRHARYMARKAAAAFHDEDLDRAAEEENGAASCEAACEAAGDRPEKLPEEG